MQHDTQCLLAIYVLCYILKMRGPYIQWVNKRTKVLRLFVEGTCNAYMIPLGALLRHVGFQNFWDILSIGFEIFVVFSQISFLKLTHIQVTQYVMLHQLDGM